MSLVARLRRGTVERGERRPF